MQARAHTSRRVRAAPSAPGPARALPLPENGGPARTAWHNAPGAQQAGSTAHVRQQMRAAVRPHTAGPVDTSHNTTSRTQQWHPPEQALPPGKSVGACAAPLSLAPELPHNMWLPDRTILPDMILERSFPRILRAQDASSASTSDSASSSDDVSESDGMSLGTSHAGSVLSRRRGGKHPPASGLHPSGQWPVRRTRAVWHVQAPQYHPKAFVAFAVMPKHRQHNCRSASSIC